MRDLFGPNINVATLPASGFARCYVGWARWKGNRWVALVEADDEDECWRELIQAIQKTRRRHVDATVCRNDGSARSDPNCR